MAVNKLRPEYSSLFGAHERNVALCTYVPKKNKAVFLIFTMHSDTAVNVDEQKKPHMIMYYNKYKTVVDTMDPMVSRYTCHRRMQRWPLAMFFNILDVGALAAYLIYYENNNMLKKKNKSAMYFLASIMCRISELLRIVPQTSNLCVIIRQRTRSRTCSELSLLLLQLLRKKLWLEIVLVG